MIDDMDDYGQFIEIDIIIDSNIKKYDDIISQKIVLQLPNPQKKQSKFIIIFVNVCCFIVVFILFEKIYVSPPFK